MCSEKKNHICHQRLTINERESIILMHTFLLHFIYVYRSVLYVCLAAHYDQVNDARMWMDRGNQAQYLSVEPKQKKNTSKWLDHHSALHVRFCYSNHSIFLSRSKTLPTYIN